MHSPTPDLTNFNVVYEKNDGSFEYSLSYRTLWGVDFFGSTNPEKNETKVSCHIGGEQLGSFNGLVFIKIGTNEVNDIRSILAGLCKDIRSLTECISNAGEIDDKNISELFVELLSLPKNNPKQVSIKEADPYEP